MDVFLPDIPLWRAIATAFGRHEQSWLYAIEVGAAATITPRSCSYFVCAARSLLMASMEAGASLQESNNGAYSDAHPPEARSVLT
jgi:hypothetical protein